ncbi:HEPN domain-containing protein [Chitinophaga sancti]|uniref:HEPN domain-containing protein n=1 Tax=Chitinophaga sancti TaxID=1004 RepID=A0A1K1SF49_9BACT|nr:HEPN domain-containing protein [Chitinophaga sancti]WQD60017.1 HEPN domain-containing protein [Chitinophaga sancti]WQG87853.1 HEPN domain-containing protein [Chitinophaga sancti]SFW82740.1 HEPN domain-containing protein [Chitinophaga sancti]
MNTTTFQHLAKPQREQLVQLIQKIVKNFLPLKIICYGYRTTTMSDWSCFFDRDTRIETTSPTYDLLIITDDEEKRQQHEIVDMVEKYALSLRFDATIIVLPMNSVNKGLENGKRFVSSLFRYGVILYSNGFVLSTPRQEMETSMLKDIIEANWHTNFDKAQRYLKTAAYCFNNGWNELTVFDLHQSVEHACIAILRAYTGYRPTTHNLSRLLKLTCNISLEVMVVFPCLTKEETDLFNTLNRAYTEARYKDTYSVSTEVTKTIMDRVITLLNLIEKLYERKRNSLESALPVSFPLNVNSQ